MKNPDRDQLSLFGEDCILDGGLNSPVPKAFETTGVDSNTAVTQSRPNGRSQQKERKNRTMQNSEGPEKSGETQNNNNNEVAGRTDPDTARLLEEIARDAEMHPAHQQALPATATEHPVAKTTGVTTIELPAQLGTGDKPEGSPRTTMNRKPVIMADAKTIINFKSELFQEKLLCDGLVFNLGRACAFSCQFCYAASSMRRHTPRILGGRKHQDCVVRNGDALQIMEEQLKNYQRKNRANSGEPGRVIFSSTLVDIAANMELARETAEACKLILEYTGWDIRLLTKSNLLPWLVKLIPEKHHQRLILGVSTGTLNDDLARSFEIGCPPPSKRLKSLHWLQDNGFRTFGMLCPSLPQEDYSTFARQMLESIRAEKCEHVWAEVMNVRKDSRSRTVEALKKGGFEDEADRFNQTMKDKAMWAEYAWKTFDAYRGLLPEGKLRFLQYGNRLDSNSPFYTDEAMRDGAVMVGKAAHEVLQRMREEGQTSAQELPRDIAEVSMDTGKQVRLNELEEVIEKANSSSIAAGHALREIHDARLWQADYTTFAAYLRTRWGFTAARASQLMGASQVADIMSSMELNDAVSERVLRPLVPLLRVHPSDLEGVPRQDAEKRRAEIETQNQELVRRILREATKENGRLTMRTLNRQIEIQRPPPPKKKKEVKEAEMTEQVPEIDGRLRDRFGRHFNSFWETMADEDPRLVWYLIEEALKTS